nr:hypothetical protein [Rhodoferax sp.]
MHTSAHPHLPALRSGLFTVVAATALLLSASCVLAQAKNTMPATITSLSQTLPTVAGVPTLLTVMGSGDCKYRVGYTRQGAPIALQTQWTYSSTPQNPFPMRLKMFDATPPGTYNWVVNGTDGCMGSQSVSFTVR